MQRQRRVITALKRHTLWLSLLLHLLFVWNFAFVWTHQVPKEEAPSLDISSYVYNEPSSPAVQQQATPQQANNQKARPVDKNGIEKPQTSRTTIATGRHHQSEPQPIDIAKTTPTDEAPVHLIGESKVVKPLIKILGQALSAHLVYPRIALDFNLRGTAHVGFLLSPNGQVSNAQVVKSSGAGVLDDAALSAVNAMSPVHGVTPYVDQPKFLIVGIIFG